MQYPVLYAALKRRLEVVADHEFRDRDPQAHLQALMAAAAELDQQAALLPSDVDPNLRHYLDRQSYLKAVAWLEGS